MASALLVFVWSAYGIWRIQLAEPRLRQVDGVVEANQALPRGARGEMSFVTSLKVEGQDESLRVFGSQPIAPGEQVRVLVDPEMEFPSRVLFAGEAAGDAANASRRLGLVYLAFVSGCFGLAAWLARRAFRRIRR